MQVLIDGVPYVSACAAQARIVIAISTHNRAKVLTNTLDQHLKHLPTGALVFVIDDGSKPAAVVPEGVQLIRHNESLGIWHRSAIFWRSHCDRASCPYRF